MGFLSSLFSSPSPPGPRFRFANGSFLTPEQYGEMAIKSSWGGAVAEVQGTLGGSEQGAELSLIKAVDKRALHAAVQVQMLKAAIYMWYAASVLDAERSIMEGLASGMKKALSEFQMSPGKALSSDFQDFLLTQICEFAFALDKDAITRREREAGEISPFGLPSTELLIDSLCRATGADELATIEWKEEITTSLSGWWLRNMLDCSTTGAISAIQQELRITLQG